MNRLVTSTFIESLGLRWAFREDAAKALRSGSAVIINLGDKRGKGTHWVAAIAIHDTLYYADPFGSTLGGFPPSELDGYSYRVINRVPFQRLETSLCGYYSICFALAMNYLRDVLPRGVMLGQKDFEELLYQSIV